MTYNPATASLEEARQVVELIRKRMQHANGEDAADLSYELETWERVIRAREDRPLRASDRPDYMELSAAQEAEIEAAAIEEDRRFEQYRDDKIAARHGGR